MMKNLTMRIHCLKPKPKEPYLKLSLFYRSINILLEYIICLLRDFLKTKSRLSVTTLWRNVTKFSMWF